MKLEGIKSSALMSKDGIGKYVQVRIPGSVGGLGIKSSQCMH